MKYALIGLLSGLFVGWLYIIITKGQDSWMIFGVMVALWGLGMLLIYKFTEKKRK